MLCNIDLNVIALQIEQANLDPMMTIEHRAMRRDASGEFSMFICRIDCAANRQCKLQQVNNLVIHLCGICRVPNHLT